MLKLPENKTRKRLRITQCVLYLLQVFLCTMTYVTIPNPSDPTNNFYATVFDMLSYLGGSGENVAQSQFSAFQSYIPYYFIFILIPIIGFCFCAFDKERNLKNIVSLICCLIGVLAILLIITINYIDIGSTLALLLYIAISFITTIAMLSRLTKDDENEQKPKKKKISKYDREY